MKYRVHWLETITCWVLVEAESMEKAVEMVKRGEYDNADSDPGKPIKGTYTAERY